MSVCGSELMQAFRGMFFWCELKLARTSALPVIGHSVAELREWGGGNTSEEPVLPERDRLRLP